MVKKKVTDTEGYGITRRQALVGLSQAALGGVVAATPLSLVGGIQLGTKSLETKIQSLEYYHRLEYSLAVLNSFANQYFTEEISSEEAFRRLFNSIVFVEAGPDIMSTGIMIGDYVLCSRHGIAHLLAEGKEFSDGAQNEVIKHGNSSYIFRFVDDNLGDDLALVHILSNEFNLPPH